MSNQTCEWTHTYRDAGRNIVTDECDRTPTKTIIVRDHAYIDTPFELGERDVCDEHAERIATDVDTDAAFSLHSVNELLVEHRCEPTYETLQRSGALVTTCTCGRVLDVDSVL